MPVETIETPHCRSGKTLTVEVRQSIQRPVGVFVTELQQIHTLCPAGLERIKATPSLSGYSHPLLPQGTQIHRKDLG